jgi:hypothetical protein
MLLDLSRRGLRISVKTTVRGHLEAGNSRRQCSISSAPTPTLPAAVPRRSARGLAPLLVRLRDDAREGDRRVPYSASSTSTGRDVLAAGDDDVLGPVLDLHVAVRFATARSPEWNQPPANACSVASGS